MIGRKNKIDKIKKYPIRVIAQDIENARKQLEDRGYIDFDPDGKLHRELSNSKLKIYEFGEMINKKFSPEVNDYIINPRLLGYKK